MKEKITKTIVALLLVALAIIALNPVPVQAAELSQTVTLTDAEIEDLQFMREEEKLARDVYLALYDVWGVQVFSSISRSEAVHMNAVLNVMNTYGISDPAASTAIGEFTNPDLQALYNQLIVQGSVSLEEALKVGGAIEEIDILDLQSAIAGTANPIIEQMYQFLMSASENHLRAFANIYWQETSETYTAQFMTADTVTEILSSSTGWGRQMNGSPMGGTQYNGGSVQGTPARGPGNSGSMQGFPDSGNSGYGGRGQGPRP